MKCPECGGANEDGAAICEHCDHIIDPSFLGDDYTQEADGPADLSDDEFDEDTPPGDVGEDTPPEGVETGADTHAGPEPASGAPAHGRRASMASSSYRADEKKDGPEEWEDEEFDEIERQRMELRAARQKDAPPSSKVRPPQETAPKAAGMGVEVSRVSADVESFLSKLLAFWKGLVMADKLTIGGSLAMFLFTLFPWVEIQGQGTLAGLEVGGWFLMLLAACAGTLVYLRQDEHWRGREKYILIVQTAVAGISVLFVLVKLVTRGSVQVKVTGGLAPAPGSFQTSVAVGLVLAFLASLAVGAGTGLLFKEKVLKK